MVTTGSSTSHAKQDSPSPDQTVESAHSGDQLEETFGESREFPAPLKELNLKSAVTSGMQSADLPSLVTPLDEISEGTRTNSFVFLSNKIYIFTTNFPFEPFSVYRSSI